MPTSRGTRLTEAESHHCDSPQATSTTCGSVTFGLGFTHDLGTRCGHCRNTEARCAYTNGCCDTCTHRFGAGARYQRRAA